MDELKKYLQKHAGELNLDEPGAQVWQNIQQETGGIKKPVTILVITRWAVAACVLVLAGIGTWQVLSDHKTNPSVPAVRAEKKNTIPLPLQSEPVVSEKTNPPIIAKIKTNAKTNKSINPPQPINSNEDLAVLSDIENSFTQVTW